LANIYQALPFRRRLSKWSFSLEMLHVTQQCINFRTTVIQDVGLSSPQNLNATLTKMKYNWLLEGVRRKDALRPKHIAFVTR
jgi:hypothetical protein